MGTTQEIINQLMTLVLTGLLTLISVYVKNFFKTKIDIAKYGFDNDKLERIIDNAVNFAEAKGKEFVKIKSEKIASIDKLQFAKNYIDDVDSKIVIKYGTQLEDMIERKVIQKFGV